MTKIRFMFLANMFKFHFSCGYLFAKEPRKETKFKSEQHRKGKGAVARLAYFTAFLSGYLYGKFWT